MTQNHDDKHQHHNLLVCTDLSSAAKQILRHSFAILNVNNETHRVLQDSWLAARAFLSPNIDMDTNKHGYGHGHGHGHEEREATVIRKYRRIHNGALLGYNRPSNAKLLFRSLFVNCKPHIFQPWPHEDDKNNHEDDGNHENGVLSSTSILKASSTLLVNDLHTLLVGCLEEVKKTILDDNENMKDEHQVHFHSTKKRKRETKSDLDFDSSHCPLDYFLYHNQGSDCVNCSEHIDRGALICISLTNVCGLEVRVRAPSVGNENENDKREHEHEWICPETISVNQELYQEREVGCSDMVCILSGDQLRQCLDLNANHDDQDTMIKYPGINACVHRVKRKLRASRLSISYELRGVLPSASLS